MKKRLIALTLMLSIALSLFSACSSGEEVKNDDNSESQTEVRDTLVYGLNQEPAKLDPQYDSLLVTSLVNKQIYDTLLRKNDTTGKLEPWLATEWEWVDDTTLHMTLRDDVYFHNGEKLTAEDVAYTIKRCSEGSATASLFRSFDAENTTVLDETHVEIKMLEPFGATLNILANVKASIVCKSYCESADETAIGRAPIGSGPFSFVGWVDGDCINLTRNDNYWGNKPVYKNLTLRVLTDATARAIDLETGGVDIIDTMNTADIERFGDDEKIQLFLLESTKLNYLVFNEDVEPFSNEKVRLAMAHAIDMENVAKVAFGSAGTLAKSSMATSILGYKEEGVYSYDVELAKQLMNEAGYADGFTYTMVVPTMSSNVRTAEAVQSYLKEINITVNIETYDAATWLSMCRDGSADSSLYSLTVDTCDPNHNYMNLYADSGWNTVRTNDETVNKLLGEGRCELDEAKRLEIYAQVQDYIFEHAIEIPVVQPVINYAVQSYVKGFVPNVAVQPDLTLVYFE